MPMVRARDPGLQPERTGLAWWRTSLSMLAVALLSLRTALTATSAPALLASLLAAAAAVAMLRVGGERPSYRPEDDDVANRRSRRTLVGVAAAVAAIGALHIAHMVLGARWE